MHHQWLSPTNMVPSHLVAAVSRQMQISYANVEKVREIPYWKYSRVFQNLWTAWRTEAGGGLETVAIITGLVSDRGATLVLAPGVTVGATWSYLFWHISKVTETLTNYSPWSAAHTKARVKSGSQLVLFFKGFSFATSLPVQLILLFYVCFLPSRVQMLRQVESGIPADSRCCCPLLFVKCLFLCSSIFTFPCMAALTFSMEELTVFRDSRGSAVLLCPVRKRCHERKVMSGPSDCLLNLRCHYFPTQHDCIHIIPHPTKVAGTPPAW